ncbi:MAG: gliding motility-associated C-terminal domain-containing protein, partial [Prevotellaceae bacterium]|nr:gliding motility-associated C-terminal domain-containing protein [Prevotellaceae bacterium]
SLRAVSVNADTIYWTLNGQRLSDSISVLVRKNVSLSDTGLYTFVAVNGCNSDTVKVAHVIVNTTLQQGSVFTSDTLRLCEGELLRLRYSAHGATNYSWYKDGVQLHSGVADTLLRVNAVSPNNAGRYVVAAYSACDTLRDTINVVVNAAPIITVQPADTSVCDGSTAVRTFTATNAASYGWYTLSGVQVSSSDTLRVKADDIFYGGRYYGVAINGCRTVYTDTIEIHIGNVLQLHQKLPDTLTLCEGEALDISLAADNLFRTRWMHNGDTLSITDSNYHVPHVTLRDTGLYVVKGYNGCGVIFDTTFVVVKALPRFTLQPRDTSLCGAGTATLTARAAHTAGAIQWYKKGSGLQSTGNVLTATTAGFYYALARNGCDTISSDTVEVGIFTQSPVQTLTLSDTTVCEGTALQLTVKGNNVFRYAWRRSSDTLAVTASNNYVLAAATLADSGMYYVTGYNACGSFADSARVRVASGVSVQRVSRDTFLCAGESYTLTVRATSYDSIAWFFGNVKVSKDSTYRIGSISKLTSGAYRYEVYGNGACSGYPVSGTVRVVSDSVPPALTLSMSDVSLCSGAPLSLGAGVSNSRTYSWLHNNTLLSSTDSLLRKSAVALSDSGIYIVEAINGCGSVLDTAHVSVHPRAQAAARYTTKTLCFGDSLSLRAVSVNADSSYWLLNGRRLSDSVSVLVRKNVSLSDTGLYTFIAVNGCNSDTVKVAHVSVSHAVQQRRFMQDSLALCEGDSLGLAVAVDNAEGYRWFRNGVEVIGATDSAYSIPAVASRDTGRFVVQAYNSCSMLHDTVHVSVLRSIEIISKPADTSICKKAAAVSFTVVAKNEDSIAWYFRDRCIAKGATLTLSNVGSAYSGYYRYEVYGQLGCKAVALSSIVDSVWLHIPPEKPVIATKQADLEVCEGANLKVELSASHLFRCTWTHNGQQLPLTGCVLAKPMEPSDTGTYCVEGYNACGRVFDTVHVALVPKVSIRSISRDTAICKSAPLIDFAVDVEHADSVEWRFRGALVAKGNALRLTDVSIAHSGYYTCVAYSRCGNLTDSVRLFVSEALSLPRGNVHQEDSLMLCLGDNMELTYTADNVFRNSWRHNGVLLPAASDTVYRKENIALQDEGWYVTKAYNGCNIFADSIYVSIASMPRAKFTVKPLDTAICGVAGSPLVTFAFSAQDYEAGSIRWYHNGSEMLFMRDTFITVKVDAMSKAGMYRYEVISEGTCRQVAADSVELAISSGVPSFSKYLGSDTTICGSRLSDLSVSVKEFYRNRWYRNDSLISEGRDTVLRINSAGNYKVVSYNGCGEVADSIKVQIYDPARVIEPPKSVAICFDSTSAQPQVFKLTAAAVGDSLREVRWYHGSVLVKTVALSGAASTVRDTLTVVVNSESEHREGEYRFVVGSICGEDTATVRVDIGYYLRVATPLPRDTAACEGASVAFGFAANNAVRYSWYKDYAAAPIPGADSSVLAIPSLAVSDSGVYVVVAHNGCHTVSDTIRLAVNPLPKILQNPASVVVFSDAQIVLTGSAAHADQRQWLYNGQPVANIPEDKATWDYITGATTDTLTIWYANSFKHAGSYRYVVSNGCGADTGSEASVAVKDTGNLQLTVQKTAWNLDESPVTASVAKDSVLIFKLLVTNNSRRFVAGIQITDTIPAGFKLNLDGLAGKVTGDSIISYTLTDTLFPNGYELLEYRVKAVKTGLYTNYVHVTYSDVVDSAQHTISDSAAVTIISELDVKVTKEIVRVTTDAEGLNPKIAQGDTAISVGDYITYKITVSNAGRSVCSGVVLTDAWSSGVKFVSVVRSPVAGVQQEHGITFAVGAIAADSAVEVEVRVRMIDDGFRLLSAHATADGEEADTLNNSAALRVRVHGLIIHATTITPNGDGHNDNFEIPFALSYPDNQITIFNRTGNMVYTKKSYYNEFNGEGFPDGTYYYIFVYRDEEGRMHRLYGPLWITRLY